MSNIDTEFMQDIEKSDKNSKIKIIVLIIIITILGIILGYKYFSYKLSPINIVNNFLDTSYNKINKLGNKYMLKDKYKIDGESKLVYDNSNLVLDYNMEFDYNDNILYGDISYSEDNKELVNVKYYNKQNDVYLFFKDIYDKVIVSNNKNLMIFREYTYGDVDRFIYLTKEIIKDNLNESDIVVSSDKIDINNNNVKVDKYMISLSGSKLFSSMKKNDEYVNLIGLFLNISKEDVKNLLDNYIDSNDVINFNIYFTNSLFNKNIVGISYKKSYLYVYNGYYSLLCNIKDNVISINGNKDDKDINLEVYNNNKFISNVSLGDNNISVTGEDNFNISYSDNKLVLSFVYDKYKVESNIYFSKIDNISKFDYSNSVNIMDIDSDIIDKFIDVFKKSKIIKLLGE